MERRDACNAADRLAQALEASQWGEAYGLACWLAWATDDAAEATRLWGTAAELAEARLRRPVDAELCAARELEIDPGSPAALERMARLLEGRGRGALAAPFWERLGRADLRRAPEALARAAKLYAATPGSEVRAAACRLELLRRAPTPAARDAAVAGLVAARRFRAAAVLLDRADLGGPADRADALARLGQLLVDEPLEHPLAQGCLERAAQLVPGHAGAAAGLGRLHAIRSDWGRTARELRASAVDERDRRTAAGLYLRLAQLHAAYDPAGPAAVDENLRRCFLLWPGMAAALDVLERLSALWGDTAGAAGRIEGLAAASLDRTVAAELWERAARLRVLDPAGRPAAAAALVKACELDPARGSAALLLAEMAVDEGQHRAAAELLSRHLAATRRPGTQLLLFVVRLLLSLPELRERAREPLELLLAEGAVAVGARELLALCEESGDPELLARALDLAAAVEPRREVRLERLDRLVEIHARAGRPRIALVAAAEALWLEPGNPDRLEQVERLAAAPDARADLEAALRRALDAAGTGAAAEVLAGRLSRIGAAEGGRPEDSADPRERLVQLREVAEQAERRRAPAAERIGLAREILALDEGDSLAARRLLGALAETGAFGEAAGVAAGLLAREADSARAQELRVWLAGLYAARLGRAADALSLLRQSLDADPSCAPALRLLHEVLLADPVVGGGALELACAAHGSRGDWGQVIAAIELRLRAVTDDGGRRALLRERARIQEERLMDPRSAFATVSALVAEAPEAELLEAIVRLAPRVGQAAQAGAALLAQAAAAPAESRLRLARTAARLAAHAGDDARQLEAWGLVLSLAPDDAEAARARAALAPRSEERGRADAAPELELGRRAEALRAAGDPAGAVGALGQEIALWERKGEARRAVRALVRRARIEADDLGEAPEAIADYRRALALQPGEPEAVDGLASLLGSAARREAAEALVPVYEAGRDPLPFARCLAALRAFRL